jgi:hypothetical protein
LNDRTFSTRKNAEKQRNKKNKTKIIEQICMRKAGRLWKVSYFKKCYQCSLITEVIRGLSMVKLIRKMKG